MTWAIARKRGQIRRLDGGTGATRSPAWGEHGEDPQFDAAEHGARLSAKEGRRMTLHRRINQPSQVKRSA